jgi:hypothetical protein
MSNIAKIDLLNFMNALDFDIADIMSMGNQEFYAHKMNDSAELVWFPISAGGSGFNQLFKGAIREACRNEK